MARQALGVWEAGRREDDYVHACVCFMHNVTSAVALSRFCSICVQLPVTTSEQLLTRHPWPKAGCSFLHILAFMSSARQGNICALSPSSQNAAASGSLFESLTYCAVFTLSHHFKWRDHDPGGTAVNRMRTRRFSVFWDSGDLICGILPYFARLVCLHICSSRCGARHGQTVNV